MKLLKQCLELESQWEELTPEARWSRLQDLKAELAACKDHPEREYRHLSQLTRIIRPEMNIKDFFNLLVPIERLHRKKTTDAQILIHSEDRSLPQTRSPGPLIVVLDNLRSAFNVGSIARVADCVGAQAIFACGYTAGPDHPQVAKSALGSEQSLEWQHFARLEEATSQLKKMNYQIFALETATTQSLFNSKLPEHCAFILGNERFGLDAASLKLCDGVLQIPTFGLKNSLNVATSFALSAYEWKRQRDPELFL